MSHKTEEKIISALESLAPECFDEILKQIDENEEQKNNMVETPTEEQKIIYQQKPFRKVQAWVGVAAAVFVCVISIGMFQSNRTAGTIMLDVNPSIAIELNQKNEVKQISAQNEDARAVIDAVKYDLDNVKTLQGTLPIILGELEKEGYFADGEGDILVSYEYKKQTSVEAVLHETKEEINTYAEANVLDVTVITQSFPKEDAVTKEAEKEGISCGKYIFLKNAEKISDIDVHSCKDKSIKDIVTSIDTRSINEHNCDFVIEEHQQKEDASGQEVKADNASESTPSEKEQKIDNSADKTITDKKSNETSANESTASTSEKVQDEVASDLTKEKTREKKSTKKETTKKKSKKKTSKKKTTKKSTKKSVQKTDSDSSKSKSKSKSEQSATSKKSDASSNSNANASDHGKNSQKSDEE